MNFLTGGLLEIVAQASHSLDEIEAKEKQDMHCGEAAGRGMDARSQVRYLYQVARGLVERDESMRRYWPDLRWLRVIHAWLGLNLVMAEDSVCADP